MAKILQICNDLVDNVDKNPYNNLDNNPCKVVVVVAIILQICNVLVANVDNNPYNNVMLTTIPPRWLLLWQGKMSSPTTQHSVSSASRFKKSRRS